jgi:hypothetical protein
LPARCVEKAGGPQDTLFYRTSYGVRTLRTRFLNGRPSALYSPTAGARSPQHLPNWRWPRSRPTRSQLGARVWTRLRYLPTGNNGTHRTAPGPGDLARARSLHQALFLLATTSSDVVCVHQCRAQLPLASLARRVNGALTSPDSPAPTRRRCSSARCLVFSTYTRDRTRVHSSQGRWNLEGNVGTAPAGRDRDAVFLGPGALLRRAPLLARHHLVGPQSCFSGAWGAAS